MVDSSPQAGFKYVCNVESRWEWPKAFTVADLAGHPVAGHFTIRHYPMVTVAQGHEDTLYKSAGLQHMLGLQTGTWSLFEKARREVRTFTSDQGLEADIPDTPCLYTENFGNMHAVQQEYLRGELRASTLSSAAQASFFLPLCLIVADCLHIVFNAFEETVVSSPVWAKIGPMLTSITVFLSTRDLRNRFAETCMASHPLKTLVTQWSINKRFNWKWEYMEAFLRALDSRPCDSPHAANV